MLFRVFLIILISTESHAYLDPASGSALLYIVISVIGTAYLYFKNFLIKCYCFLFNRKEDTDLNNKIVFYSEGRQYWPVFSSVIEELINEKYKVTFLTSDKDDPAFTLSSKYLDVRYIGSSNMASIYLNSIVGDVVVMTTPQLEVLNIKRSKKVKHYTHLVHAPVDIHTYRKFAFDYFDSVLCSGKHQMKSIRHLEKKRSLPKKELFEVGLTYLEDLSNKLNKDYNDRDNQVVLIAPTWKEYSLMNGDIESIIKRLLDTDYKVILRPHPQTYISYPQKIDKIEKNFSINTNFRIDKNTSAAKSMEESNMMISDLSGVIWDYLFLYKKPVVLFQTPERLKGFESTEIDHLSWEKEKISKLCTVFEDKDITNISSIVKNALSNKNEDLIDEVKNESIFRVDGASKAAAERIIKIMENVQ